MSIVWKWSNGYLQEVKRNTFCFYSKDWSSEHLNFKYYSIEREVTWKNTIFNYKLYEKGEQNIQF